jgi:hypothetical protein
MSKKNKILVLSAVGIFVIAVAIILVNFFFSNKELISRIPKDSFFVVRLDLRSLSEKAEISKWSELEMFKSIETSNIGNELKVIGKICQTPETSGIDFKKCVYAFFGEANEGYHGVLLALNESEKFESTIKSLDPSIVVQNNNNVNSAVLLPYETVLIWNDDVAMFYSRKCMNPENYAISIFNQDGTQSMLDNNSFMEFESNDEEMAFYVSATLSNSRYFKSHASHLNKLNGVGVFCHFENNDVIIDTRFYGNDEVEDSGLEFFNDQKLSENINVFLSQHKSIGFLAGNLNLNNILDVANLSQMMFGKSILSNADILEAFSGEALFAINDYRKVPKVIQTREKRYRDVIRYNNYNSYGNYWNSYYNRGYYNNYYYEKEVYWELRSYTIMEPVVFFKTVLKVKNQEKAQLVLNKLSQNGVAINNCIFKDGYLVITNDVLSSEQFDLELATKELVSQNFGCAKFDLNLNRYPSIENDFKSELNSVDDILRISENATVSVEDGNLHCVLRFSESTDPILWRVIKILDGEN